MLLVLNVACYKTIPRPSLLNKTLCITLHKPQSSLYLNSQFYLNFKTMYLTQSNNDHHFQFLSSFFHSAPRISTSVLIFPSQLLSSLLGFTSSTGNMTKTPSLQSTLPTRYGWRAWSLHSISQLLSSFRSPHHFTSTSVIALSPCFFIRCSKIYSSSG